MRRTLLALLWTLGCLSGQRVLAAGCPSDSLACSLEIVSAVEVSVGDELRPHREELEKLARVRLFYDLTSLKHEYESLEAIRARYGGDSEQARKRGYLSCVVDSVASECATALHVRCVLHGLGRPTSGETYESSVLRMVSAGRLEVEAEDAIREIVSKIGLELQGDRYDAAQPGSGGRLPPPTAD